RHGLEVVAQAIVATTLLGVIAIPTAAGARWLLNSARRPPIRRGRAAISALLLMLALAGICFWPLPCRVSAPAVLESRDAQRVYVVVAGRLQSLVAAGDAVRKGQELARLTNLDLHKETSD